MSEYRDVQYESQDENTDRPGLVKERKKKVANRVFNLISKHDTPEDAIKVIQEQGS